MDFDARRGYIYNSHQGINKKGCIFVKNLSLRNVAITDRIKLDVEIAIGNISYRVEGDAIKAEIV